MKIYSIFAFKLFSFKFPDEDENELKRLLTIWRDPEFLEKFYHENRHDLRKCSFETFAQNIIDDANQLDDTLYDLSQHEFSNFDLFFKQLNNQEYQFTLLSKRKGRINNLRLYALKIDANCYVITGGAIKLTHLMEERPHTLKELVKMDCCRRFLNENGVIDNESFYVFLIENI